MADDTWSSNSTDSTTIRLHHAGPKPSNPHNSSFKPTWTYSIFGDEEAIFGYEDLEIEVNFAAHDLYPHLSVSHGKVFKAVGDTKAQDVNATLEDFLPEYAFESAEEFQARLNDKAKAQAYVPPGEVVHTYSVKGRQFEIRKTSLSDSETKLLLERMQIFISFFIEGGTFIDIDDVEWALARWTIYFVYEILPLSEDVYSKYSFVGYCTTHRFLPMLKGLNKAASKGENGAAVEPGIPQEILDQAFDVSTLHYRQRISQFLILPCHGRSGHGLHLYKTITEGLLADPKCIEITVEDPSEAFDVLRDICDWQRLHQNGTFAKIILDAEIDPKLTSSLAKIPSEKLIKKSMTERLRRKNKIPRRQWSRLLEMLLLSRLPQSNRTAGVARLSQRARAKNVHDRAMYYIRLLMKERIYKQHIDVLRQMEKEERTEKLNQTLEAVLDEYELLLIKFAEQELKAMSSTEAGPSESASSRSKGKRKVVLEEEEDVGDESPSSKRAKV